MPCRIWVAVVGLTTALGCSSSGGPAPDVYWVAPDGDDGAAGAKEHPFATLTRARDAVRTQNDGSRDFTIQLRGGTYFLAAPLQLDARDGGGEHNLVTWRAADGETPVLSGGVTAPSTLAAVRQLYVDDVRVARPRDGVEGATGFADGPGVMTGPAITSRRHHRGRPSAISRSAGISRGATRAAQSVTSL